MAIKAHYLPPRDRAAASAGSFARWQRATRSSPVLEAGAEAVSLPTNLRDSPSAPSPPIYSLRPSCRLERPRSVSAPVSTLQAASLHIVDADPGAWGGLLRLAAVAGLDVAVHASLDHLLAHYRAAGPACLILDQGLLDEAGLSLTSVRSELGDAIPVILVSTQGDIPMAVAAIRAGAANFFVKPVDPDRLLCEIRRLLLLEARDRLRRARGQALAARLQSLTPREQQVLTGVAEGRANKRIATEMGISPRTVEAHRAHLMRKLGVRSLPELVVLKLRSAAG